MKNWGVIEFIVAWFAFVLGVILLFIIIDAIVTNRNMTENASEIAEGMIDAMQTAVALYMGAAMQRYFGEKNPLK